MTGLDIFPTPLHSEFLTHYYIYVLLLINTSFLHFISLRLVFSNPLCILYSFDLYLLIIWQ